MNDIGGNVCIRDGERTDYCWREAVKSLLPICDTVTICDGESSDGTWQAILEWAKEEPKIRPLIFPWPNPKGNFHFWVSWLNFCREAVPNYWHLQLDADEVLSERSYDWILGFTQEKTIKSAWGERYNFWKDPWHLIPKGHKCGHRVVRLGPQCMFMPTDYPHPDGEHICRVGVDSPIEVFHYGMLRRREGIQHKERVFQDWVFGSLDPRLVKAEQAPDWNESIAEQCGWRHLIEKYTGYHPEVAKPWLRERGYDV